MARPKFIADADLSERLIAGVRRRVPDIDFLTAAEGGTRGLADPEVLAISAASGRVLVSHDCNTMVAHFYRFIEEHDGPGLVVIPQDLEPSKAIEDLILIWEAATPEEIRNKVRWLPI
jgi:hypothetical protein